MASSSPTSDAQERQRLVRRTKVRILPSSALRIQGDPPLRPPSPPPTPPPDPSEMIRIVVLGDRGVGKSSVVRKFVSRQYARPNDQDRQEDDDAKSHRSGRSRSSRSARSGSGKSRRSRDRLCAQDDHSDNNHQVTQNARSAWSVAEDTTHTSAFSVASNTAASSVSENTIPGHKQRRNDNGIKLIKAEYHRKDLSLYSRLSTSYTQNERTAPTIQRGVLRRVNENQALEAEGSASGDKENAPSVCARMQIWDATGRYRHNDSMNKTTDNDIKSQDASNRSAGNSTVSDTTAIDKRWGQIFKNTSGVVLVCNLGTLKPISQESRDAAGRFRDWQSIMEQLEKNAKRWLQLVECFDPLQRNVDHKSGSHRDIPVILILNKSDQISQLLSSSDWVRVGAQVERLCERLNLDGWYTSTCVEPNPTDGWSEDHDGAELAFLSLCQSYLAKKSAPVVKNEEEKGKNRGTSEPLIEAENKKSRKSKGRKGKKSALGNAPPFPA